MANPLPYVVSYSFGGFQASAPAAPLPGSELDGELGSIATAVVNLIAALEDIRRSDGALNNGIVTFDSFENGLKLLIDPTNGQLVAAAVAGAQASATSASGSASAAAASAATALTQALAAAASASTVNLALYLAKSNNLAELGSLTTSRSNLGLGSCATFDVGAGASNIVQLDAGAKIPAYDGSQITNVDVLPVGAFVWSTSGSALPGTVKGNGALLSRASFPRLWTYANASANITSEAGWSSSASGAYSTGDLSTTFRIPDVRGEFIRGLDDGRGIDASRPSGSRQADSLKDHTHPSVAAQTFTNVAGASGAISEAVAGNTGTVNSPNGGGTETRPRNIPFIGCIKY